MAALAFLLLLLLVVVVVVVVVFFDKGPFSFDRRKVKQHFTEIPKRGNSMKRKCIN